MSTNPKRMHNYLYESSNFATFIFRKPFELHLKLH